MGFEQSGGKHTENVFVGNEKITLSDHVVLEPLALEHKMANWLQDKRRIKALIHQSSAFIVEYFPPDMDSLFKKGLRDGFETLTYFTKVATLAAQQDKEIIVLDPAHDKYFVALAVALTGGPVASIFLEGAAFDVARKMESEELMTRRAFLERMSKVLLMTSTIGVLGSTARLLEQFTDNPINFPPHYQNLRRAVIARGLRQLAGGPQNTDAIANYGLLYPPAHVDGILDMMGDPGLADTYFKALSVLKEHEGFRESLFSIRRYRYTGVEWKLTTKQEIR